MKTGVVLLVFAAVAARPCFAQWAVIDAANLQQSATNYAVMVQQIAKQAEQISNQVRQIQQVEDQLKRMGSMADFKAVIGFPQLSLDLSLPTKIQTWTAGMAQVNGSGLFGDSRGGIYTPVADGFTDFDGTAVARDPVAYKPAQEVTARVDEFKGVQADVYARRAELKNGIAQTSTALQAAETDAEEQKLHAVLQAQYSELATLDSEVAMSAAEIQVQAAESSAMTNAQSQADAESRRTLAQQEAQKIGTVFKPIYQSVLQYVSERPFQP